MDILINILISIIAAGMLAAVTFFVISRLKGDFMNLLHALVHGCLFLFVFIQTLLFMGAWDDKTEIEDMAGMGNALFGSYFDFADQFEDGRNAIDELYTTLDDVDVNPLLEFFGIELGEDGFYASQEAVSYYNTYMWHRVFWALGVVALYIIICVFAIRENSVQRTSTYKRGRMGHSYSATGRRK